MSIFTKAFRHIQNYESQDSLASKLRRKRIAPVREMIEEAYANHGHVSIIDVGGTAKYWNIIAPQFLAAHRVNILIVNLPGVLELKDFGLFKFIDADGCNLDSFDDKSFHIGHSNSVIEQVGDWDRMVSFAREISRVSVKFFVQTPNYWFPVDAYTAIPFFHWLPRSAKICLLQHFQLGLWWKQAGSADEAAEIVDRVRLLTKSMFRDLFWDAHIISEKFFLLPKSFIAVRR